MEYVICSTVKASGEVWAMGLVNEEKSMPTDQEVRNDKEWKLEEVQIIRHGGE